MFEAPESKFPNLGISIFPTMSALAIQHKAINLAQGFPGFQVDQALIDLVYKYMKEGWNQYSPMPGVLKLREALSQKQSALYNVHFNPETEITISAGATEAVFSAISAIVNEGDEVICFEPVFDIYPPAVALNKGKLVRITLKQPNFSYDWDEVAKNISPKTRLIILNSPHNPTGKILTKEDLDQLAHIVRETNIILISDEVYEHMVFDKQKHICLSTHPDLKDRTMVIASLGKVFHCTGWRIGYCMAPERLSNEFRKTHQFVTFSANTAIQYAMADYLCQAQHYESLPSFFQHKRDFFLTQLKKSPFKLLPCEGSYFLLADYSSVSNLPDIEFAKWLTIEKRVASIPISVFYSSGDDNKIVRFCFAKEEHELAEAAHRLSSL